MEDAHSQVAPASRRHFFGECATGLAGIALSSLLSPLATAANVAGRGAMHVKAPESSMPHFPPSARRIIYIHMDGGPSQLDMFEHKPVLTKYHGQPCPEEFLKNERFAFIKGHPKLLGSPHKFAQYGANGTTMSNLLPHLAKSVDELCFVRSMYTEQFNHGPAQLFVQTGSPRLGRPSIGSWISYGLGTENNDLPAFVVLLSGERGPSGGTAMWGNGFLPSVHQGVQMRSQGDPVLFLTDPDGISRQQRRGSLDALKALNEIRFESTGNPEINTRINQFELAYRMQTSVPGLMNVQDEPEHIHKLYGTEPGKRSFANNCLLARRLVERGVRFVQLYHWGWDSHGQNEDEDLRIGLVNRCRETDQATAALITDLKQRGMLDDTLIVWGGEFGRTPMAEGLFSKFVGRDHHRHAFTVFMAGGGLKSGFSLGNTDELGWQVTERPVHVHDLQATILRLMGIDHLRLVYRYQGRDFRLTDVAGQVVEEVIA